MRQPQISVVVPTYQRPEILRKTLQGLRAQSHLAEAEVLVICDGPDERSRIVAKEFAETLSLRYEEQAKQGVAAARNKGIKLAKGSIVLFLDDDVIPGPEFLKEHLEFHANHNDERTALLGYVTWHSDLRITPYMRWYGEYGALFGYALLKENAYVDPRFFYSCNVSLKRTFLERHKGFQEALTVLEDNELGFRLAADGMQLKFSKAAIGYHYQQFTFEQSCQRLARYRPGLKAFLSTRAGAHLLKRRRAPTFRFVDLVVRATVPLLAFLRPLLDSAVPLPRALYRMFYWYYGTHRQFWSRAGK